MKGHMHSLPCPVIQKHTFKGRKENTPQGNTQAHTPAGTHTPGQWGRRATQAQFVRMERKYIIYSSQHPPPTTKKGCGKYYLLGAPIWLKPVCDGTNAKHFGNLLGSIN